MEQGARARRTTKPRAVAAPPAAPAPFTIIEALEDDNVFRPWFEGESWDNWRTILKAAFALPMTPDEIAFFRSVAERDPPTEPVSELWLIVGRRGGKDSVASVLAAHMAAMFDGVGHA